MKRLSLIVVVTLVFATFFAPSPGRATPPTYDLTCTIFGPTGPTMPLYPVPGAGVPDGTDRTGRRGTAGGSNSCGWGSRAYRVGEQLNLCGTPALMSGIRQNATSKLSVYNDGKSCMVVTAVAPAGSQTYPDVTVVCHAPLRSGSAPASSFYQEVEGSLGNASSLGTLPPGSCAASGGGSLPEAAFCVASVEDAVYKNQLQDLGNGGFYQFTAHADPGCNVYESGTLKYLGAAYQPAATAPCPPAGPPVSATGAFPAVGGGSVLFPKFGDVIGSGAFPRNDAPAGHTMTVQVGGTNYDRFNGPFQGWLPILYVDFTTNLTKPAAFPSGIDVQTAFVSPACFNGARKYRADIFAGGLLIREADGVPFDGGSGQSFTFDLAGGWFAGKVQEIVSVQQ